MEGVFSVWQEEEYDQAPKNLVKQTRPLVVEPPSSRS